MPSFISAEHNKDVNNMSRKRKFTNVDVDEVEDNPSTRNCIKKEEY